MEVIKSNGGGILRGRQHPSYYLLVTALCILWDRRRNQGPYNWVKFRHWVTKQQLQTGRFVRLSWEEIRSAYLEAREKIFRLPDHWPIEGESTVEQFKTINDDIKKTNASLGVLTDEKEIARANELIQSIKDDGVEGEENLPFSLLTK